MRTVTHRAKKALGSRKAVSSRKASGRHHEKWFCAQDQHLYRKLRGYTYIRTIQQQTHKISLYKSANSGEGDRKT